jgi:hypothetical protein
MITGGGRGAFARCTRQVLAQRIRATSPSWPDLLDRSASTLAGLGVRPRSPFDLERFLRELVQLRGGREIVLTPISVRSGGATVCGYCLTTAERDHVYYAQSRSRLHRTHNAVHELAHLLLDHRSVAPLTAPGGPTDRRRAWLGVADIGYSERSEDEADAAAAILLGSWHETTPRTWVAHSALSRGAARLADAYS